MTVVYSLYSAASVLEQIYVTGSNAVNSYSYNYGDHLNFSEKKDMI